MFHVLRVLNYCVSSISFGVVTSLIRRDSSKWKNIMINPETKKRCHRIPNDHFNFAILGLVCSWINKKRPKTKQNTSKFEFYTNQKLLQVHHCWRELSLSRNPLAIESFFRAELLLHSRAVARGCFKEQIFYTSF